MSQKHSTRQVAVSARNAVETKKDLQERWKDLELKPATLLHLQEVMDTSGVAAAFIVTEAVTRQKEKQGRFADIGKEWGSELLRLLSLEGVRPHLIDLLRFVLEALLAWHFISLPSLSSEALSNMVEVVLAMLFLVMGLIGIFLTCQVRRKRSVLKKETPRV